MKKNIIVASIFYCFPLFVYAAENKSALPPISKSVIIGNYFWWMIMFSIPILVLLAIILGIRQLLKKNDKNKKRVPTGSMGMLIELIIPYSLFAGMFVFSEFQSGVYLCDCFANYKYIMVSIVAILFFIGSIWISYLVKKNSKEWKILYTLLIIISFLITFYLIMAIGEYFYVPSGF